MEGLQARGGRVEPRSVVTTGTISGPIGLTSIRQRQRHQPTGVQIDRPHTRFDLNLFGFAINSYLPFFLPQPKIINFPLRTTPQLLRRHLRRSIKKRRRQAPAPQSMPYSAFSPFRRRLAEFGSIWPSFPRLPLIWPQLAGSVRKSPIVNRTNTANRSDSTQGDAITTAGSHNKRPPRLPHQPPASALVANLHRNTSDRSLVTLILLVSITSFNPRQYAGTIDCAPSSISLITLRQLKRCFPSGRLRRCAAVCRNRCLDAIHPRTRR